MPIFAGTTCLTHPQVFDASGQTTYFNTKSINGVVVNVQHAAAAVNSTDGLMLQVSLRQKYTEGVFKLFAGCLPNVGDASRICSEDIGFPNSTRVVWKEAAVDPFTQSVYHMAIDQKVTNSQECLNGEYALMLKAENNHEILWSAVIGKADSFSLVELSVFPLYMAYVHGSYENQRYRFHVILSLILLGFLANILIRWRYFGIRFVPNPTSVYISNDSLWGRRWRTLAMWSVTCSFIWFTAVTFDIILHFSDSSHEIPSSSTVEATPLFLLLVSLTANVIPTLLALYLYTYNSGALPLNYMTLIFTMGLVVAYTTTLCFLGDTSTMILVCTFVIFTALNILLGVWRRKTFEWHVCVCGTSCIGSLLILFLGSGYWIGPAFLLVSGIFTLLVDWANYPTQSLIVTALKDISGRL